MGGRHRRDGIVCVLSLVGVQRPERPERPEKKKHKKVGLFSAAVYSPVVYLDE
jgi:hypothetical protein